MSTPHPHRPESLGPLRFPFRFERAYQIASRPFGITPERAWVELRDGRLEARFGPWRLQTPVANIRNVRITGPYRIVKTAGPARLAITDRGLTFATNRERGVLICFAQPVRGIEPLGILRHPELTVTVADPERLIAGLEEARARDAGAAP